MRKFLLQACFALIGSSLGFSGTALAANKAKFSDYEHGKPVDYLPCGSGKLATRTAVLMGGGVDVGPAFSWMIEKMTNCASGPGKPGNLLVIRAGGNPAYDSYIYKQGLVASVQTIVIPNKDAANDPAVVSYIRNAGAVWLTGGDQGDYYNFWKGTLLISELQKHLNTYGVPIGGTSAGMMILSQVAYIADPYTITSSEALLDPYKPGAVTLKNDFWPARTAYGPLMNTVTDSHFDTRDRMGRTITFLARVKQDKLTDSIVEPKAIAVDQEAALAMESDWGSRDFTWKMFANSGSAGSAYLLQGTNKSKLVVSPGTPLTFTGIQVQKFTPSGESRYSMDVQNGVITSDSGSIY